MYPRQSPTTHTEQLGDEASVSDWTRAQVHALNPTAAHVWRQCDGATSPEAIAASLARHKIPEAAAIVELTLRQLARLHLLAAPVESPAQVSIEEDSFDQGDALLAEIEAFLRSVREGSPPVVSGEDGLRALETAMQITRLVQQSTQKQAQK